MNSRRFELLLPVGLLASASCSVYDGDDSPSSPQEVSDALSVGGGLRRMGTPPPPGGDDPPVLGASATQLDVIAGGQVAIPLSYSGGGGYSTCYAQVPGAVDFFEVPAAAPGDMPTALDVTVPAALSGETFCFELCVAGPGGVSNIVESCITVGRGSDVCAGYAAKSVACDPEYSGETSYLEVYCNYSIAEYTAEYGAGCGQAFEDYFACLSALGCEDFLNGNGCGTQEQALDQECGG